MKKSIVISMALFALAFGANAGTVTLKRAERIARSWLVREGKATSTAAVRIQRSASVSVPNARYHLVKVEGGGTVITSSDDADSPIIAFTDSGDDVFADAQDEKSPLYALLKRDAEYRHTAAVTLEAYKDSPVVSQEYRLRADINRMRDRNRREWERLDDDFGARKFGSVNYFEYGMDDWFIVTYSAKSLYDIRVQPLVGSRWSQSDVGGQACYNWFTPNPKNPLDRFGYAGKADNSVCGCVATAMAQVLRYFAYTPPDDELSEPMSISSSGTSFNDVPFSLKLQAGKGAWYDWDDMTLVPGMAAAEGNFNSTNRIAIGKLCSDAGLAVGMMYTPSSSGAYSSRVAPAITGFFKYKSVRTDCMSLGTGGDSPLAPEDFPPERSGELQRVFFSNFDAGLPLIVGLTGHEVVADGYGYSEDGLDYVHINMGWGGSCDMWYLLPNVCCDSNGRPEGNMMFFQDCVYNIFPTNDASYKVMSGRVTDDDGVPISGATVKIFNHGSTTSPIAEFVTGDNGIWGFITQPGTYDVEAANEFVTERVAIPTFSDNRWGCDVVLAPLAVENMNQAAPTNMYPSLNKAIAAANSNDVLRVYRRTHLKKSLTLDKPLTIYANDAGTAYVYDNPNTPTNCLIICEDSAQLTVAPGVRAEFISLAFESGSKTVINVETNGVAAFAGMLGVGTVKTADEYGFELMGSIDFLNGYDLFVDCAKSKASGKRIGTWTCGEGDNWSARKVLNPYNPDLGGVAQGTSPGGAIIWGTVDVDPRRAVAKVGTTYYRTMKNLFEANPTGDLDIQLVNDVEDFDADLDITGRSVKISSESGIHTIKVSSSDGFTIGAGGKLEFENVTFDGFRGERFVYIPDGSDGEFDLGANTILRNLRAIGDSAPSGLIVMMGASGKMKMDAGSMISDCVAENGKQGSIISLYKGDLEIAGGAIIGCSAEQYGGAVYFNPSLATLKISGAAEAWGNLVNGSKQYKVPNDIYISSTSGRIEVTGDITSGKRRIGVCGLTPYFNTLSNAFANVTGSLTDPDVFFNSTDDGLAAIQSGSELIWDAAVDTYGQCAPAEAKAIVHYSSGDFYYASLEEALNHLHDDATIDLDADQYLSNTVSVAYTVTINGNNHRIVRDSYPCIIKVTSEGALTLKDVEVLGYNVANPWFYYLSGPYVCAQLRGSNKRIFEVNGGKLDLQSGTKIHAIGSAQAEDRLYLIIDIYNQDPLILEDAEAAYPYPDEDEYDRASCAVVVWNEGEFTMEDGVEIYDCWNEYAEDPVNCGATAGILIENSTAYISGGNIHGCIATLGSAMNICQKGVVYLSGTPKFAGNVNWDGDPSNFRLEDLSKLYIDDAGLGAADIGFTAGIFADPDKVTEVLTNLSSSAASSAATRFHNDASGTKAVAVSGDDGCLIVWTSALADDNKYYEVLTNGITNVWTLVGSEVPKSASYFRLDGGYGNFGGEFVYDGTVHEIIVKTMGCEVSGVHCATNADHYTVTLTPSTGYAWEDGSTTPTNVTWEIEQSPLYIYPVEGQFRYFGDPEPVPFEFTAGPFYNGDSIASTLTGAISHEYFEVDEWALAQYTMGTLVCTNSNYFVDATTFNPDGTYFYIDNSRTNTVASGMTSVPSVKKDFSKIRSVSRSGAGNIVFGVSAPIGVVYEVYGGDTIPELLENISKRAPDSTVILENNESFEIPTDADKPARFFKIIRK